MSITVDDFANDAKWSVMITGTGAVLSRTSTTVIMQVLAVGDEARLRSKAFQLLEGTDVRVYATRGSYQCRIALISTIPIYQPYGGYYVERTEGYGLIYSHGGSGGVQIGADPLSLDTPEELRITCSGGVVAYYVNGVQVFSAPAIGYLGTTFYVEVYSGGTGANGLAYPGTNHFSSTGTTPTNPSISIAPLTQTVYVGTPVSLTATPAGGTSPYTVRWYDGTTNTLIGTGLTYTFTPTAAGVYSIYAIVTDASLLTATSQLAVITVNPPATLQFQLTITSTPLFGVPFTLEKLS